MSGFKKFVAIALVLALLTSITAFANENTGYNVEIYDGETKITIYTNATSAAEVIKESGLSVTALDEVDLSDSDGTQEFDYARNYISVASETTLSDFVIAIEMGESKMMIYMAGSIQIKE